MATLRRKLDRLEIARILREARMLLDLRRENRFRARAYETGARALERMSEDLPTLVRERRLTEIPGIGHGLAAVIAELFETGESPLLERLRAEVRPGALELSRIPGMTSRRLGAIQSLGIDSILGLKAACEQGLLRTLKGFGEKTEKKILEGIARHDAGAGTVLLPEAVEVGEALAAFVRAIPGCTRAEISGDLRRSTELVGSIDVVAAFSATRAACEGIARFPLASRVERSWPGACALRLADGTRAVVSLVRPHEFGNAWHRTTGSERHVARVAELAARISRTRDDTAAPRSETSESAGHAEEDAIYARAGLSWIPPELREDAGEIEAALAGETFEDLVRMEDVQGMVHCHTTWSDGRATVEEMVRAAHELGMKYITITDHSPAAGYAGGLTHDRLLRQWDEIDRVASAFPIRIFKGTESDILADGSLDYPLDVLERLDVVIASVHVRHKMDEAAMTRRVIDAMRQPVFKIWGHALGRLLKRREPFACRVAEVLDAIAVSPAAIEINGDPHRLDLEPRWIREARKRGIPFVISTDAHSVRELGNLRYGVAMARRGGVRRGEVLNGLDADGFAKAVRPRLAERRSNEASA